MCPRVNVLAHAHHVLIHTGRDVHIMCSYTERDIHRERHTTHDTDPCKTMHGDTREGTPAQHGIPFLINSFSLSLFLSLSLSHTHTHTHPHTHTHTHTAREPRQVSSTGYAAEHVLQHVLPRKLTALSIKSKSGKLSTWIDNLMRLHPR